MSKFDKRGGKSGNFAQVGDRVKVIYPVPPYLGGEEFVVQGFDSAPAKNYHKVLAPRKDSPLVTVPCLVDEMGNLIPKQCTQIMGRAKNE